MQTKVFVWKDPVIETGEKGILHVLNPYAWDRAKRTIKSLEKLKRHYVLILGEHQEVSNPLYVSHIGDNYRLHIRDFDLWFYGTERSKDFVINKSSGLARKVPSIWMPATHYLIDGTYWTPDPSASKCYDFICCCND